MRAVLAILFVLPTGCFFDDPTPCGDDEPGLEFRIGGTNGARAPASLVIEDGWGVTFILDEHIPDDPWPNPLAIAVEIPYLLGSGYATATFTAEPGLSATQEIYVAPGQCTRAQLSLGETVSPDAGVDAE
jgi:hypothetical protein